MIDRYLHLAVVGDRGRVLRGPVPLFGSTMVPRLSPSFSLVVACCGMDSGESLIARSSWDVYSDSIIYECAVVLFSLVLNVLLGLRLSGLQSV